MEYVIRENFRWVDVCSGRCHSGKCPSGKFPFEELTIWGTVLQGNVRLRSVCRGNIFGEMSVEEKFVWEMSVGGISMKLFKKYALALYQF